MQFLWQTRGKLTLWWQLTRSTVLKVKGNFAARWHNYMPWVMVHRGGVCPRLCAHIYIETVNTPGGWMQLDRMDRRIYTLSKSIVFFVKEKTTTTTTSSAPPHATLVCQELVTFFCVNEARRCSPSAFSLCWIWWLQIDLGRQFHFLCDPEGGIALTFVPCSTSSFISHGDCQYVALIQ